MTPGFFLGGAESEEPYCTVEFGETQFTYACRMQVTEYVCLSSELRILDFILLIPFHSFALIWRHLILSSNPIGQPGSHQQGFFPSHFFSFLLFLLFLTTHNTKKLELKRPVDKKSMEDLDVHSQMIIKKHIGFGREKIVNANKEFQIISSSMSFLNIISIIIFQLFSVFFPYLAHLSPLSSQLVPRLLGTWNLTSPYLDHKEDHPKIYLGRSTFSRFFFLIMI